MLMMLVLVLVLVMLVVGVMVVWCALMGLMDFVHVWEMKGRAQMTQACWSCLYTRMCEVFV